MTTVTLTPAQRSALLWLRNRNGTGVFDRTGFLIAAGERAPVSRASWNRLAAAGLVEFYLQRSRLRITDAGRTKDLTGVSESGRYGEDAVYD